MKTRDNSTARVTDLRDASEQNVDFDTLISSAGLGKYQLFMLFYTFPFYMFSVFVYYSQIFITEVPPHWCWIPDLSNLTSIERRDLAIPNSESGYSQCSAYNVNWNDVIKTGQRPNETWGTIPCSHGWEFDREKIPYATISSDLEWVCEKKSYQSKAQAIFFTGSFFGGITVGFIADRYGRVPATIISNLLGCIGGVASSFATSFTHFSISRFIMGMAYDTCLTIPFLLVLEFLAPKFRSKCANTAFAIFYSLFATTIPFVALACGNWKILALVTSLPLGLAVLTPIFIPESPRWLLSRGRVDEAIAKVVSIGKQNNREIPSNQIRQFKETASRTTEEHTSKFEIFKRPLIWRTLIIVCIVYMFCEIVFDGLIRNLQMLHFDFFLSFVASSSTELPSILLCAFTMDLLGRRWTSFSALMISSVFSVLIVFVNSGVPALSCAVVARFTSNMSYNIIMQWAAEILPTHVRGTGLAFIHVCGNFGYIASSCISYLKNDIPWAPFAIISVVACSGALLALMLPETSLKELPHTFDDAENLIRSWKMWDVSCGNRYKEKSGKDNQGFEM